MSYVFPPQALIPVVMSMFVVENVTNQFRLLFLVALCCMEAPLLPKVLDMLVGIPHQCLIVKDGVVGQMLKGLPLLHSTLCPFRDVFCTDKGSFPQSFSMGRSDSSIYNKSLPALLERTGTLVCS